MFICDKCKQSTQSREACNRLVVETRPKVYQQKVLLGEPPFQTEKIHESRGTEIVKELKLCGKCYVSEIRKPK